MISIKYILLMCINSILCTRIHADKLHIAQKEKSVIVTILIRFGTYATDSPDMGLSYIINTPTLPLAPLVLWGRRKQRV